jgi:hypothetical protein
MRFFGRAVLAFPAQLLLLAFLVCLCFAPVDSDDGESIDLRCHVLFGYSENLRQEKEKKKKASTLDIIKREVLLLLCSIVFFFPFLCFLGNHTGAY